MKVLHVTHQYRPALGGAEKYITDVSEELARRGHQVDVFAPRSVDYQTWQSTLPRYEQLDGVDVYRFDSWQRTPRQWAWLRYGVEHYWPRESRWYEPWIFFGSGPVCPAMFWQMLRQVRRYDLVHINNLHYSHAYPAYRAARLRGVPVVITPHVHAEQPVTYDIGYLRSILRGSAAIFADTTEEQTFLRDHAFNDLVMVGGVGLQLDRLPPLDRAASRAQFDLPPDAFVILFLGRKVEYKGIQLCVEAFTALRRTRPNVYLLAVGPETDYSRKLWARTGLLDGVIVRDTVSDEDRLHALNACDVLALPSTGEAFGIVYLEAWAYRKPVIGANIASVSSLIEDGGDGYLIDPAQPAELAERLAALIDQPEFAQAMGRRGRAKLERRYTLEHIGELIEGTYARVLRRQASVTRR
jgi:glycosyltransferase involved in cell wall biosynthesis